MFLFLVRGKRSAIGSFCLKLFFTLLIIGEGRSMASVIVVQNTNDIGPGSLRQAILDSDPNGFIRFNPALIASGNDTIFLESALFIDKPLFITGVFSSTDSLFISGQNAVRVFTCAENSGDLFLDSLCLVNGFHNTTHSGAAIYKMGTGVLELSHCYVAGNVVYSPTLVRGAAIQAWEFKADHCLFENNIGTSVYESARGGSVFAHITCEIKNSTIRNNEIHGATTVYGGGIYSSGPLTISYSTVSGNLTDAYSSGGGVSVFSYGGGIYTDFGAEIDHSTISYNKANSMAAYYSTSRGGGIYIHGDLELSTSTVCFNDVEAEHDYDTYSGGVYVTSDLMIRSNIIAFNTTKNISVPATFGVSNGYNFIGDAIFSGSLGTDYLGVTLSELNLGALQDNGLKNFTHMPGPGSIAIDGGSPGDLSFAQNVPVTDGTRDAGAAERHDYCLPFNVDYINLCDGASYLTPFTGALCIAPGTFWDTLTMVSCDSLVLIHISDLSAPVPDSPFLPIVTADCSLASLTAPTATDNCSGVITGITSADFPYEVMDTSVIAWEFLDAEGNLSYQFQTIVIIDTVAPVPDLLSLPDLTAACSINSITPPTATDVCTGSITATTLTSFPMTDIGVNTVIWLFDDGNGNISQQFQTVTLTDSEAPVPNNGSLPSLMSSCFFNSVVTPTATDNCEGTIYGTTSTIFPLTAQGTTVVTWIYDDGNGNTSSQTQTLVIDDVTPPLPNISSLPVITDECEVSSLTPPMANDNCVGPVTATTTTSFPVSAQGTTIVTWTYDDGNGNISSQNQSIVISDITVPVPDVTNLPDIVAACSLDVVPYPTATDNCDGTIMGDPSVSFPITSSTTILWFYEDSSGNLNAQWQEVIIEDDITAPVPDLATLPDLNEACEILMPVPPTATDNCAGLITGTTTTSFPVTTYGITTLIWEFNDGNGNITTQSQNLIIGDNIDPVAAADDGIIYLDASGNCSLNADDVDNGSSDNCNLSGLSLSITDFDCDDIGNQSVDFMATDQAGNSTITSITISVLDTVAPVPDIPVLPQIISTEELISLISPGATDNCGMFSVTHNAVFPITSSTWIIWTYTDVNGNSTSQVQEVIINSEPSSITEQDEWGIALFPNPNDGGFYLKSSKQGLHASFFTADGKMILSDLPLIQDKQWIRLPELQRGLYFIQISDGNKQKTIRFTCL